jgi:parvulin-like peptidyl-prolyl isomerase
MKIFKSLFILIFIASFTSSGCRHAIVNRPVLPSGQQSSAAEASTIVVARVNEVPLFMDSLVAMMNRIPSKNNSEETELLEEHRRKALDKLVLQELAYQQARTQGVSIGADKVDMAIRNLKDNLGGEKEYNAYLSQQNVTESQLRAQVERSLTIELMYAQEVLAKVSIPEETVKQEYEKQKHLYIVPEKISVTDVHILDKIAPAKTAEGLLEKIKADTDKDPWHLVLDGSFIVKNIELSSNKDKALYEAAKRLKPGELSAVLTTATGTHIIRLTGYTAERQLSYDEVRTKLELKFKTTAQEQRTREWEQELRLHAKIDIVNSPSL